MHSHLDGLKTAVEDLFDLCTQGSLIASLTELDHYIDLLQSLREVLAEAQRSGDMTPPVPQPGSAGYEASPIAWWYEVLKLGSFDFNAKVPPPWPASIVIQDFYLSYFKFTQRMGGPAEADSALVGLIREFLPPTFGNHRPKAIKLGGPRPGCYKLPTLRSCRRHYLKVTGLSEAVFPRILFR
jgi:hypothetical protein